MLRTASLLSGAALSLTFPTPALWWWAYVGLVPVLLLVAHAADRREAVWRTWLAGIGFFGALHWWLLPFLSVFVVPVVAVVGIVWVPWGLAAWSLLRPPVMPRRAAAALVVLPSVWLVIEYFRSWDRFGGSWGYLGLTQWERPAILAVAALGGVWALSLLLLVTNVAATIAFARSTPLRVRLGVVGIAGALVAGGVGYGLSRDDPTVEGRLLLGGVQPGVVHDPVDRLDAHVRITRDLVEQEPGIEIVYWGQSSVGFDLQTADEVRGRLVDLAAEIGRPIVVNVDARRPDGRISKSAVVVEPDGLGATYRKQRLVPFGEYIPLRPVFGWVERFTEAAKEDRVPGTSLTTFRLAGAEIGPLISYESTFPDMRRTLARMGVEATIVQAAATTFQGTWALPQQASYEAVRAVESGRPATLVAVSGTSASFDPRGERLAWVPQTYTGGWTVDIPLSRERPLFVRWGAWIPVGALVITLVAGATALVQSITARRARPRAATGGR